MRNKTDQFRRKYNQGQLYTQQNSPKKQMDKTFYRSTRNLQVFAETPVRTFRTERQLKQLPQDKLGFLKDLPTIRPPRQQRSMKAVSIKESVDEVRDTTISSISNLRWRTSKGCSPSLDDARSFIKQLSNNQLFYCSGCYQYIFQIEKGRHYPLCRDKLNIEHLEPKRILKICWQRLEKIVVLSQYTNTRQREVQDLWKEVKQCQFSRMLLIVYPAGKQFFKLEQILEAFVFTYEQLLKGQVREKSDIFKCL